MPRGKTLILTLLALIVATGCSLASEPVPAGPVQSGPLPGELPSSPVSQPVLAEGEAIYAENCAACHGVDGTGGEGDMAAQLEAMGVELPDLTTEAFLTGTSPSNLYSVITNGTMTTGGMMPPWRDSLSENQRWNVAYYLYTLGAGEETLANGQAIYEDALAECVDQEALNDALVTSGMTAEEIIEEQFAGCAAYGDLSVEELNAAALFALNLPVDGTTPAAAGEVPAEEVSEAPLDEVAEEPAEAPAEDAANVPAEGEAAAEGDAPAEGADTAEEAADPNQPEIIERGEIAGVVTMGEGSEPVPEGTEVLLTGYVIDDVNGVTEFIQEIAMTDAEGGYAFSDVQFDIPSSAYAVSVTYDGLEYSNGSLINPHEKALNLPINVFGHTNDADVITIKQFNVIAEPIDDNLMVVTQFVGFHNASDEVYFSDAEGAGISVAIPAGAESIEFQDNQQLGVRYEREGNLIKDTFYVYPGDHAMVFRYMLPVNGAMELELPLLYPVEEVNILVPEGTNLKTQGVEYTQGEPQQMGQSTAFDLYTATDVGNSVAFGIGRSVDVGNIVRTVLIATSIVAGLGLIAYAFITRGGFGGTPEPAPATRNNSPIIQQIVELDRAFEAGKLSRVDYETKRAALKLAAAEEA